MATVNPIPDEKTPPGLEEIYAAVKREFGRVLNFFKVMAHRPEALRAFCRFYDTVLEEGTVEARYKQLAYLYASILNACRF